MSTAPTETETTEQKHRVFRDFKKQGVLMMQKFSLLPDEFLILKAESVSHGDFGMYTNDLYLTNRSLVFVQKGMFGKIKNEQRFYISEIKVYNGKPQTFMVSKPNGNVFLEIHFRDSIEAFGFPNTSVNCSAKQQVSDWINAIFETVTGRKAPVQAVGKDENENDGTIIGIFKEISRDIIGIKPKRYEPPPVSAPEYVSKKCISCLAPLYGTKGELVHCEYCDTDQVL